MTDGWRRRNMELELNLFGNDLFGRPMGPENTTVLSKEFTIPPFSVLNARGGEWKERRAAWLSLGIQSELGRGA